MLKHTNLLEAHPHTVNPSTPDLPGLLLLLLAFPPNRYRLFSTNLCLREIHFGMLGLKLAQHLHLLLLLTRRLPQLLLPLVVHHLLDHAPRLAVQIAQLAVLGRDLGRVDLRRRGDDVRPPLHLVDLVQVDGDFLARGRGLERPG